MFFILKKYLEFCVVCPVSTDCQSTVLGAKTPVAPFTNMDLL